MKRRLLTLIAVVIVAGAMADIGWHHKYEVAHTMRLPLREVSFAGYPENPAELSVACARYNGRSLTLVKRDDTHFDYILEPGDH